MAAAGVPGLCSPGMHKSSLHRHCSRAITTYLHASSLSLFFLSHFNTSLTSLASLPPSNLNPIPRSNRGAVRHPLRLEHSQQAYFRFQPNFPAALSAVDHHACRQQCWRTVRPCLFSILSLPPLLHKTYSIAPSPFARFTIKSADHDPCSLRLQPAHHRLQRVYAVL